MKNSFFSKLGKGEISTMQRNAFQLLSLAVLLTSFSAVAQPIEKYCLTKTGERTGKDFTGQSDPNFKAVTLSFSAGGKKYKLVGGIHHIGLFDEHNKLIETNDTGQKQGRIERIEIKGKTLIIEGGTDYQAAIDLNVSPPLITNPEEVVNLDFTAGGRSYKLVAESNQVILFDDQKNKISAMSMDQYSEDGIFPHIVPMTLTLSKNGWLWINGNKNYVAHIDQNATPPTISKPVELSALTRTECLPLTWLGKCRSTQGVYSHALDGILVSSTKRSFFGLFPPVSFLVKDGKPIPLPKELNDIRREETGYGSELIFFTDLPALNGVLFRGADGVPLFYDGQKTKRLSLPKYVGSNPGWYLKSAQFNKHTILAMTSNNKRFGYFHFEVNPDLSLTPIPLLDSVDDDVSKLGIFWVGKQGIYVEKANELHSIINVPKEVNLWKYEIIDNSSNIPFVFEAINYVSNKSVDYFIVPSSTFSHCIAKLDLNKPIMIDTPR